MMSFMRIGAVRSVLYMQATYNLHPYFLHFLSYLDTIQYTNPWSVHLLKIS